LVKVHLEYLKIKDQGKKVLQKVGEVLRGGWHCSWCYPIEGIQLKLKNSLCGDGIRYADFGYGNLLLRKMVREGLPFGSKTLKPMGEPNHVKTGLAPHYVLSRRHRKRFKYLVNADDSDEINSYKIKMPYCICNDHIKQIISSYTRKMSREIAEQINFWCTDGHEILQCLGLRFL